MTLCGGTSVTDASMYSKEVKRDQRRRDDFRGDNFRKEKGFF